MLPPVDGCRTRHGLPRIRNSRFGLCSGSLGIPIASMSFQCRDLRTLRTEVAVGLSSFTDAFGITIEGAVGPPFLGVTEHSGFQNSNVMRAETPRKSDRFKR